MEVDIIITLSIAAFLLFLIGQVARTLRTNAMQKTLRAAIEKGQAVTPALMAQLEGPPDNGAADQRIGFVLIALALALFGAGLINPGEDNWRQMMTIGLFPLFVGAALLLRLRLARRVEP